jgi:hypothetical protein
MVPPRSGPHRFVRSPPGEAPLRLPPRLRILPLLLPVAALAGFLVVVLAAGLLVVGQFVTGGDEAVEDGTTCEAGTGDAPSGDAPQTSAELDPVQRQTAATIIGVAKGMAIPPRGWVVALATAMQESQMGTVGMDVAVDHDSLGVFQQRPSQGWGSPEQVRDPVYATRTFFERLLTVPDWETMPVTRAAQVVQRSAFPNAYAEWKSLANSLVTDLAGVAGAIQECAPAAEAGPGPAAALPPGVARSARFRSRARRGGRSLDRPCRRPRTAGPRAAPARRGRTRPRGTGRARPGAARSRRAGRRAASAPSSRSCPAPWRPRRRACRSRRSRTRWP